MGRAAETREMKVDFPAAQAVQMVAPCKSSVFVNEPAAHTSHSAAACKLMKHFPVGDGCPHCGKLCCDAIQTAEGGGARLAAAVADEDGDGERRELDGRDVRAVGQRDGLQRLAEGVRLQREGAQVVARLRVELAQREVAACRVRRVVLARSSGEGMQGGAWARVT